MDILNCMTAEDTIDGMMENEHISALAELILCSWPFTKFEVHLEMQP